jgi:hypothetical protein
MPLGTKEPAVAAEGSARGKGPPEQEMSWRMVCFMGEVGTAVTGVTH